MPFKWLDAIETGGFNSFGAAGAAYSMTFVVAAGEIPAQGACFRGARFRTFTPSNTTGVRLALYQGSGTGIPLKTWGQFTQVAGANLVIYEVLFRDLVPVTAGDWALAMYSDLTAEVAKRPNTGSNTGRVRATGVGYDPVPDPLDLNNTHQDAIAVEVFAEGGGRELVFGRVGDNAG